MPAYIWCRRFNLSAIILLGHIAKRREVLSLGSGFLAQERFGVNLMKMAFSTADEPPSQGPLTRKRSITEVDDGDSVFFRLPQPLVRGKLVRRYKRFLADVVIHGIETTVHCPNTGPMLGLGLDNEPDVLLSVSDNPKRKYSHTLQAVHVDGILVGTHSALANKMVRAAIEKGLMPELGTITDKHPEVKVGDHRIDFRLDREGEKPLLVEVKSVTLAIDCTEKGSSSRQKRAVFPDTISERAMRHAQCLRLCVTENESPAAMVFLVQRPDCTTFSPAEAIYPSYAKEIARCNDSGVVIYAYHMCISEDGSCKFLGRIPNVLLPV